MALPNFFIIGAAKAGTTSLHYYLDQHSEIQMSTVKEPNFFSGSSNHVPYPMGRVSRRDDYERLFDSRFRLRGEASVGYANHPRREGVPGAIKEMVPEAKFIYVVRDPVARTVSQYKYRVSMEGERRSLQAALSDLSDPYSVYLCPSLYASQLELYLQEFPQDRLLVIDHAALLADRHATLREVFAFLGVDDPEDFTVFNEELNTGGEKRVYSLGYVRLRERLKGSPLRLLPRGFRRSLSIPLERLMWSSLPPAVLDDELRGRLEEIYAPEVARLRTLTGQSFSTWSI
jgi:hypothetical protein